MDPETQFAQGPEGYVAYQCFGEGPIDVLFATPWAWNIDVMWEEPRIERFFRRLSSFGRVIVFDKRGTGVSDPVPLGALPTLEQWADDIRVVIEAVGCERVALIGVAESCPMATVFAASHPELLSAFIIVNGYACGIRKDDYVHGMPPEAVDRAVEWIKQRDWSLAFPSAASDDRFSRWMQKFARLSASPTGIELMFRNGFEWDVRSAFPTISVPTLVLHRTGDRYFPVGHGRYMGEHIPGATYVELPGDDHFFFTGEQDTLLDEIQAFLTGARGSPDVDRVLATVLFTDLVSSTERAAEVGDRRWRELLDVHDRLARDNVERFRGRTIKTTGDGVLAIFDGPARAIRCAAAIGEGVRSLGVEVRAGLHAGEVELRGDDIGGIAVHIASRVLAHAGGGEIFTSSTVKDLVVGSGIRFEDRGAQVLKGVPDEWRLFAAHP